MKVYKLTDNAALRGLERALVVIQAQTDNLGCYEPVDYPETVLVDIVTDLLHYCKANNADFDDIVRQAKMHYEAEKQ